MSVSATRTAHPQAMSKDDFRLFQAGCADEERWELIDGLPVMMTPPFIDHNRIASNVERLLNDALITFKPSRVAVQRPGVELGLEAAVLVGLGRAAKYVPEPDIAVIDDDPRPERRFVDKASVLVEVVSSTDEEPVLPGQESWIGAKVRLYRSHAHCEAVVVIEQRCMEVRVSLRSDGGWVDAILCNEDAVLVLPTCGLRCKVSDIYAGTHLRPRESRPHEV